MKIAEIRFLEQKEEAVLPKGVRLLPKGLQTKYIECCKPWYIRKEGNRLRAVLQTDTECGMAHLWRGHARRLLEQLKKEEAAIVIPPLEGELPRDVLPFSQGRRLMGLMAGEGAAEALRRRGKEPAACRYLLAGGTEAQWRLALLSAGNEVNQLSLFTDVPAAAEDFLQELYAERGLAAEVFSSAGNSLFRQADVVLCCGMEQHPYAYMLGEGAVFLDLPGNRPVLRKLLTERRDVLAADGFFFRREEQQMEGRQAEAEAYLTCPALRKRWLTAEANTGEMLQQVKAQGYSVSGFSVMGRRVKGVRHSASSAFYGK
ncbi:MAG: hypothetical protein Q4C06_06495 [Bacillota bacterium]|nr:hypothetical protein [Bacillota bacterium]